MESLASIGNGLKPLTIVAKLSNSDIYGGLDNARANRKELDIGLFMLFKLTAFIYITVIMKYSPFM